jgi:monofunctional chorismate mutase
MKNLDEARIQIDEIDSKIIELYEKRMETVIEVIKYKIEHNIPILDSGRESLMLEKNLNKIKNEEFKKYYNDVLLGFLRASKDMQKDILDEIAKK